MDYDYKIKPLHIILSKTNAYIKGYDGETKWMYFPIENENLLKKYNDIWNEVSNIIKKNLIPNPCTIKNFKNQNEILR